MHMYESYGYDMKHGRVIAFSDPCDLKNDPG